MRALDGTGSGRPNDARAFVHKAILGLGGRVLSSIGAAIPLPGARLIQAAGSLATSLSGSGARASLPALPQTQIIGIPQGQGALLPRLPESGPQQQNRLVGITPQDTVRGLLDSNGACPAPVLGGNRRINAAGQQACPGFHWNQSTYTRLGGPCSSKPAGTVLKGTEQVKNRKKFNTANGPARKRAIMRLKAGEDDAKDALRAMGYRTITKRSAREMRSPARRTRHR